MPSFMYFWILGVLLFIYLFLSKCQKFLSYLLHTFNWVVFSLLFEDLDIHTHTHIQRITILYYKIDVSIYLNRGSFMDISIVKISTQSDAHGIYSSAM